MDPSQIASLLSIAQGAVQGAQGMSLKKQANAAMPPEVDPNLSSYLSELEQKRRSMETGSAFAGAMGEINAGAAGTNNAIVKAANGSSGQTIQGLLQAQAGTNNSMNQALAVGQNNMANYDNQYLGLLNKISARQMQLQLQRSQQLRAEWARKMTAANQNVTTGVAGLIGGESTATSNPSPDASTVSSPSAMTLPSASSVLPAAGGAAGATGAAAGGAAGAAELGELANLGVMLL